jgi:hypothetical protein
VLKFSCCEKTNFYTIIRKFVLKQHKFLCYEKISIKKLPLCNKAPHKTSAPTSKLWNSFILNLCSFHFHFGAIILHLWLMKFSMLFDKIKEVVFSQLFPGVLNLKILKQEKKSFYASDSENQMLRNFRVMSRSFK